ncbi:hypothetical protein IMCC1923_13080 [Rhodobacteraceae bacterium IMCC1923]|nr:hypothetical protein [Rhodobacteraceae bacterium IMCC1923]
MALSLAACGGSDDVVVDITSDNAEILLAAVTAVDATATTVAEVASNANAAGVSAGETAADAAIRASIADAGITVAADATSAEMIAAVAASDNVSVADTAKTAALTNAAGTKTYTTVDAAYDEGVLVTSADAVTAALTDAGGTPHATVDAAITSNDTAIADAATVTATAAAEATLVAGTGFDTVAALNAAYTTAIAATPALVDQALETTQDVIQGTASDDTIVGTNLTYNATDVVIGGGGDDTLTINSAVDTIAAAATVVGVENVVFNISSANLAEADVTLTNIKTGSIAINQLTAGSAATANITNAGGVTLEFGGLITGAATIAQVAATDLVVNPGTAGTVNITGGTTGSATVTSTAATFVDADVAVGATGTVTITGGSGLAAIDADGTTMNVTTTNANSDITLTGTSTDATDAATVSIGAAAAITTVNAVETMTISTGTAAGDGTQTAASVATVDTTAATTYNLTGSNDIVLAGDEAMFDGKTVTSDNTGASSVRLTTMAASDLEKVAVDVSVELADANINHGTATAITVKNNATVVISADLDGTDDGDTNLLTLDSDTLATGAETLNLTITASQTEVQEATAVVSDFETVNLSTTGATAAVVVSGITGTAGASGTAFTLATGSVGLTLGTLTGATFDATGYTGAITTTVSDATLATSATFGSGDDIITSLTADVLVIDGGDGNDNLTVGVDASDLTLSNIEVLTIVDDTEFAAAQLDGGTFSVIGTSADDIEIGENGTGVWDSSSLDLSGLNFNAQVAQTTLTIDATSINASLALGGSYSVTGSSIADVFDGAAVSGAINISGNGGADNITTGSGADVISTGEGIDIVVSGAGIDTIDLTEATAAVDTMTFSAEGATNVDTVTGFTAIAADDVIALDFANLNAGDIMGTNGTVVTAVAHTMVSYTSGATLASNTSMAAVLKITDTTGMNSFADVSTAIDANNITLGTGGSFAVGEGIVTVFYDADDSQAVVGYMESDVADVFDDGSTFVEIVKLTMSTAEYDALSAANFDIV